MHNRKGPKPAPPKGCLWIEQAAPYLGLKLSTLRKWRLLGKEPGPKGFPIGRFIAYKITDLDAYLEGQYQAATTPTPAEPTSRKPARAAA